MKINRPAFRLRCLLIAGAALAVWPASAQVRVTEIAAPPAAISGVQVIRAGQQTTVRVSGNQALHCQTTQLDNPPRIALDFADTRLAASTNSVASLYAPVRKVRLGQAASGQTRVVIDLAEFVPYSLRADGSSLVIAFSAPAAAPLPSAIHRVRTQKQPDLATVAIPEMPLPAWLTGENLAFARPIPEPGSPDAQTPSAGAPQAQAPSGKKYTGEPISVNLKDVDLKDFFRLIHEISGLNVVLDPSVKGTVTLVLDEVPWDQALDIVLRNNGLAEELDGNVLRIATQDTLKREAEQKRDVERAQAEAVQTVTVTRVLSYAKADLVTPTLKRFLTSRGDIISDGRSNMLIIRDIPSSIPQIDNLIRQLDRKSQQVEIDARVIAASRAFARDIGSQFGFAAGMTRKDGSPQGVFGGLAGSPAAVSPIIHPKSLPPPLTSGGTNSLPLNVNLPAQAPTSGISYAFSSPNFALDLLLTAMENKALGKVLSEPKGVTQNNEKLTVKQGVQVPIQTTINNTISVQYIDAVLKLEVTPQITAEGTVFLVVHVENTQIDNGIPRIQGTPALDTESADTKVLVNDGGTVVIGGVVTSSQSTNINEVPLIGSLPLIGHLFKETSVSVSSEELLFFVTPRIMPI